MNDKLISIACLLLFFNEKIDEEKFLMISKLILVLAERNDIDQWDSKERGIGL